MSVAYYQLSADELKQEREKQLEIVHASAPDDYLDAWHKLSVIESLLTWHAAEAYRSGGVKVKAVRPKVKKPGPKQQINFGRASR
jgi:hypothetical protein